MGSSSSSQPSSSSSSSGTKQTSRTAKGKSSKVCSDIQNLCNCGHLPPMRVAYSWQVYLHKKGNLHQRLIIETDKYILCVELSNITGTGSSGLFGADWQILTSIIDETKDQTRSEWVQHGISHFSLEILVNSVDIVAADFGTYNVFVKNCQTFAKDVANELGNIKVNEVNDGSKALAGIAALVVLSAMAGSGGYHHKFASAGGKNDDSGNDGMQ
mmetsp:Transcript_23245/g.37240  ORF Transcript_23245/g.37240 Transcript_23245/m.37240 type:complete len:214 (-) Transcript_23245:167-808(-)